MEREARPFEPPAPFCDLLGGQSPSPSPAPLPAPRAYTPLTGAGCGAPPKPWWLLAATTAASLSTLALASSIAFWKALVSFELPSAVGVDCHDVGLGVALVRSCASRGLVSGRVG